MKLCPECEGEFEDRATTCDSCNVALISAEEAARLKARSPAPRPDGAGYVPVATVDDPFDAEAFVAALREAEVPVFSRDRRRNAVDVLVTPGGASFWEIFVPGDRVAEAQRLIAERKQLLETEQEQAARAAEEEEAQTENYVVIGESENEALASAWAARLAAAGIPATLRDRSMVEVDRPEPGDPAVMLVLVPRERAAQARELLRAGAEAAHA